MTQNFKSW